MQGVNVRAMAGNVVPTRRARGRSEAAWFIFQLYRIRHCVCGYQFARTYVLLSLGWGKDFRKQKFSEQKFGKQVFGTKVQTTKTYVHFWEAVLVSVAIQFQLEPLLRLRGSQSEFCNQVSVGIQHILEAVPVSMEILSRLHVSQ